MLFFFSIENAHYYTDRFPARPYILEGYPKNITALVNATVVFDCPNIADIAPHIQWAKYRAFNDSDGNLKAKPDIIQFEVSNSKCK